MNRGRIVKALSGFYDVDTGAGSIITCRGRGKLRHQKLTPLVGDWVEVTILEDGSGTIDQILPRSNEFVRPAVANVDQMVIVASGAIPVTDPFLIDRMIAISEAQSCQPVICFNKCDLERADELVEIYRRAGLCTLQISAETGEGMTDLCALLEGKVSAFTGNSGVGKSSILNALAPEHGLSVGTVSQRLGRGRHTTRHVELFPVGGGLVADTPGFAAFDVDRMEGIAKDTLAMAFREFRPYLGQCRFTGCSHVREKDCAILEARAAGDISSSRHTSYVRLYEQIKSRTDWH